MGAALLLICALLLAAVLATAGAAKLLDLEGSRSAVVAFGVPPRLARVLGTLLPVAELATAALLAAGALSSGLARAGGTSALVLLGLFSVAIAASLARGRTPDCHCFGQLHSSPAGTWTLARNGGLLALAAFVATGGDPLATALAAVAALALLAVVVLRSRSPVAEDAERPSTEGLAPGTPAPGFQLQGLAGEIHTLDSLRAAGLPVLLIFSDPGCGPCIELAPEVARCQRDHADELTVAVIERDRNGSGPASPDEHGRRNVLLQPGSDVADLYDAAGTPTAVLVDRDGAIASPVAAGSKRIEALMARTVAGFEARSPIPLAVRRGLSPPLRRRELLVRGAGGWAAAGAFLAWPLRAAAMGPGRPPRSAEHCEERSDCPNPIHMTCREGRCRCDEDLTRCDPDEATTQRCFDLQSNRNHCGGCNHSCEGQGFDFDECCDGKCVEFGHNRCNCGGEICDGDKVCRDTPVEANCVDCPRGLRPCGNDCGDPQTQRCCGNKLYERSELGPGEWNCCGPEGDRRLVNIKESERNCGGCGRRCAGNEFCFRGTCRRGCPGGLKRCGNTCGDPRRQTCCKRRLYPRSRGIKNCKGKCVDTTADPKNCGDCGSKCTGPFDTGECCGGECCDINADTCCPGGCKNTALDEKNCGGCGNVCKPNEYCRFGVCTCPPGETC